jgi:hypothetical protein
VTGVFRPDGFDYDATTVLYSDTVSTKSPDSGSIVVGTGNFVLGLITSSNNEHIDIFATGGGNPNATLLVEATLPATPRELCFHVESHVTELGVQQRIELWNYLSGSWVELDKRPASDTDRTVHAIVKGDPAPYVSGSNQVKARIHFDDIGLASETYHAKIDLTQWSYTD